jgi:hypothetical protein
MRLRRHWWTSTSRHKLFRWLGDDVLDETSNYYVVAWRPEKDEEKIPKFRNVKITVVGQPELTVRAPKGYVEGPNRQATPTNTPKRKADQRLRIRNYAIRSSIFILPVVCRRSVANLSEHAREWFGSDFVDGDFGSGVSYGE